MAKTISTGMLSTKINGISVNSSIPSSSANYNSKTSRDVEYVVMHYTGNTKDIAKNNATYFSNGSRGASAHLFVDDDSIYQSVQLKDIAWHCGANSYKHASCRNANSIGIEMCCTAGNYKISDTTKKNAAYVCAYICDMLGIKATDVDTYVLRHYDVTGKNCPAQMVSDSSEWTVFKESVKSILNGGSVTSTTTTSSSSSSTTATTSKSTNTNTNFPTCPFTVQVLVSDLNIRSSASMSGTVKGTTGKGVFTITQVSGEWGLLKSGAGWIYLANPDYVTIQGSAGAAASSATQASTTATEYKVKVKVDGLNIRSGPGTSYSVVGCITDKGTYTIVQEDSGWGKLKSGAGWISVSSSYVTKV